MNYTPLHKNQTGIAAELFVAAELSRRNFNVAITFGNTKSIDLLAEKNGRKTSIQVKGIQRTKSICWNINRDSVKKDVIYILVNLHCDLLEAPAEYFIFTAKELLATLKEVKSGRDYIDYNPISKSDAFKNAWHKINN
ncbi:MAG TPA: hypothetical protein VK783_14650 [Bacteroidia bacterium]|nr:hypothetical protein [Bacteroidia bacterium]